jgi:hypothetical protein
LAEQSPIRSLANACIRRIERMPVDALRFTSIDCRVSYPAKNILAPRHDLHMCRIHAKTIPTQMVNRHPGWDRTNKVLIYDAVSQMFFVPESDLAIPMISRPA